VNGVVSSSNSDAGGVAAKKGFLYQDHIAVRYLLMLVYDTTMLEVHCETKDDISLKVNDTSGLHLRHVQVKTTDGDKKWSTEELCSSGIYEKQLKLDDADIPAKFSIISTRDVGSSSVKVLVFPHSQRNTNKRQSLINVINRKHKKLLSDNGNGAEYWVDNCQWEVIKELDSIKYKNRNLISQITSNFGFNLTTDQITYVYNDLLVRANEAGAASNKTNFEDKVFVKSVFENYFLEILKKAACIGSATKHPYSNSNTIEPFLIDVFLGKDGELRTGHGLDIGLELKKWRVDDFLDHLLIWLPEFCLQASEISNIPVNHLEYSRRTIKATQKIKNKFCNDIDDVIGNLTLHACLRSSLKSEPIPCKVFYLNDNKDFKSFRNAHLVNQGEGQNLWLGNSIISNSNFKNTISECFEIIKSTLDPSFLKEERKVIIDLFEPSHYSSSEIVDAFKENSPIDKLLEVLCITVLVIYNSESFKNIDDYQLLIEKEMEDNFSEVLKNIPDEVKSLKIYLFMIPAEDVELLKQRFFEKLG
jgi:hypothetical protein